MDQQGLAATRACDAVHWNALVEESATGNVTQTWEWGELRNLGPMHRLAVADTDGHYLAAMLMVEDRAPVIQRPYLYAPRGPVCADPAGPALPLLWEAAARLARERGAFMLKVEPNVPADDRAWLTALEDAKLRRNPYATHPRRSWVLDIRPDEATLLKQMHNKWRYNIKLAERRGVTVRAGTTQADRDLFYRLYQETATRDGFFIHPQAHYDAILTLFAARDAAVLLLAEYAGEPIAGLIAVRCGAVTTYMFGASSNAHREHMPNHLTQWTAIQWARAHGCATYDFRAIAEVLEPDEDLYSLYTYKRGYGGTSILALETHDAVYQPAIYWAYRQALQIKRDRDRQRARAAHKAREAAAAARANASPATTSPATTSPDE